MCGLFSSGGLTSVKINNPPVRLPEEVEAYLPQEEKEKLRKGIRDAMVMSASGIYEFASKERYENISFLLDYGGSHNLLSEEDEERWEEMTSKEDMKVVGDYRRRIGIPEEVLEAVDRSRSIDGLPYLENISFEGDVDTLNTGSEFDREIYAVKRGSDLEIKAEYDFRDDEETDFNPTVEVYSPSIKVYDNGYGELFSCEMDNIEDGRYSINLDTEQFKSAEIFRGAHVKGGKLYPRRASTERYKEIMEANAGDNYIIDVKPHPASKHRFSQELVLEGTLGRGYRQAIEFVKGLFEDN